MWRKSWFWRIATQFHAGSVRSTKFGTWKDVKAWKNQKRFEINQKIIRFCLDFPLKMRIFALLSEGSPVWHEHCSNTTQTLHRHDTNISALLQYFCIDFAAFALRLNPNESTNSHKFSQKFFLLLTLEISICLTY